MAAIEIERGGEKFLMLDKLRPKTKLADGHISLVARDSELQAAGGFVVLFFFLMAKFWGLFFVVVANSIATYFNSNPSRAVETMQRFYEAYPDDTVLRDMINQQLTLIPEAEILPDWLIRIIVISLFFN